MKNKTNIIIGAGKLGSSIAKQLYNQGENVLVIDKNEDAQNRLDDFGGFFECGDATDLDLLVDNGIKDAKCVIISTEDDNRNIYLGNLCSSIYGLKNIFVRLVDSRKAKLLDKGIKTICPFDLSIADFSKKYKEKH